MEHFDAGDLFGFVVVEDDAGRDFFGFDDGGIVKAQVEGISFFVDVEFHVVQALGINEDFNAGEMVGGGVVEGDAVFEVFRGYGGVCEADVEGIYFAIIGDFHRGSKGTQTS